MVIENGYGVAEAAGQYIIPDSTLRQWVNKVYETDIVGVGSLLNISDAADENRSLRKEFYDYRKKMKSQIATRSLYARYCSQLTCALIHTYRVDKSLMSMCKVLNVNRSGW